MCVVCATVCVSVFCVGYKLHIISRCGKMFSIFKWFTKMRNRSHWSPISLAARRIPFNAFIYTIFNMYSELKWEKRLLCIAQICFFFFGYPEQTFQLKLNTRNLILSNPRSQVSIEPFSIFKNKGGQQKWLIENSCLEAPTRLHIPTN